MRPVFLQPAILAAILVTGLPAAASQRPTPLAALRPDSLYKRVLPAILTLHATKKDGSHSIGTAFMFGREGTALTAYHVTSEAVRVTAVSQSGEEFEVSGCVDSDRKRDVALVRVKVFGLPLLAPAKDEPPVGTRAYVIGAPQGLEFSLSEGLVSQVQVLDGRRLIQFTCAASPGNSGGPLLNAQGEVIGIVSSQFRDGQNLNFAVPVAAGLALDATLPTKPWESSSGGNQTTSPISLADRAVDDLLVSCLLTGLDLEAAQQATLVNVVYKNMGYVNGVPYYLYQSIDAAKDSHTKLSRVRPQDPLRVPIVEHAQRMLATLDESADLLVQSIRAAQINGWNGDPNDLLNRALAKFNGSEAFDSAKWAPVIADSLAIAALPSDVQYMLRMRPDSTGFSLGVYFWPRKPLHLIFVHKGSIAEKLGLKSNDVILEMSDSTVTSIHDLKVQLVAARGQKCTLTVLRNGSKNRLWPATVPRDLKQ